MSIDFNAKLNPTVIVKTGKDMVDAIEVAKIHDSEGLAVIDRHSQVYEEKILNKVMFYCDQADKDKVFAWACQLAGFRRRANVERQIIEEMNEFIDDTKKSEEVIDDEPRPEQP